MSSAGQGAAVGRLTVDIGPEPGERLTLASVPGERARLMLGLGRLGVTWLAIYAVVGLGRSFASGILAALVITSIWFGALQLVYGFGRLTLVALGSAIPAALTALAGFVLVSAITSWLPGLQLGTSRLLLIALGVFAFLTAWEVLVGKSHALKARVLIVGTEGGAAQAGDELARAGDRPFEIVGIVADDPPDDNVPRHEILGRLDDLADVIARQRPDLIVVAVARDRLATFARLIDVGGSGFRVVGVPEFFEQAFGRLPLTLLNSAWFISVLHLYQQTYSRVAKRAFDIVIASIGALVTAPLMVLICLLVRLTPGPVIFRQTRLGEGGVLFSIYKFRTMRDKAESNGSAVWAADNDDRITRLGRLLRHTRLDELPQLWNVLRGEMSIVGPRPERPEFLKLLSETVPFWTRRHLVKPGITGWAQLNRGYTADPEGTAEKLSYDLWYLRHRSLIVDVAICARTFWTVLSGSGAR